MKPNMKMLPNPTLAFSCHNSLNTLPLRWVLVVDRRQPKEQKVTNKKMANNMYVCVCEKSFAYFFWCAAALYINDTFASSLSGSVLPPPSTSLDCALYKCCCHIWCPFCFAFGFAAAAGIAAPFRLRLRLRLLLLQWHIL